MSETKQVDAGSLKPGSYVIIDNVACAVKSIDKSKTGKHGSAKCRIDAVGLINGEKKVLMCPASENVVVPIIEKKNAQVLSVQSDVANVMDIETYETMDLKIPEEFKGSVKEGGIVNYWIIMDNKVIMGAK